EHDIRVEELENWSYRVSGIGYRVLAAGEQLQGNTETAGTRYLIAGTTEGSRRFQRCQRRSHALLHHLLHEKLVPKPSLELGWMHVHVHRITGQIEEQQQRRTIARRDRRAIPGLGRAQNERIADRTTAHEDVPFATGGAGLRRSLHETGDLERTGAMRDAEQRIGKLRPPQRAHA